MLLLNVQVRIHLGRLQVLRPPPTPLQSHQGVGVIKGLEPSLALASRVRGPIPSRALGALR